jgi:uncharacterized protein YggL (DUF469 family)
MSAPCPTFGFLVMMELAATEAGVMADLRASWLDFLETRGLYCAGGNTNEPRQAELKFVVASEASQATENDREAVQAWLGARHELRAWSIGALEDFS